MRRETSRVSFLMCLFCVPGLLSVLTTENVGVDATDQRHERCGCGGAVGGRYVDLRLRLVKR